jgi:exonuclease SbcC
MRLHRLEMQAFGPFRDRQVVDFDRLAESGLFLLTGDTGAGKTSVLDAVAYALYGQVPGRRGAAMRIRSDHADPTQPTRVQLELTVADQRLRISRVADWDRPKKRGTGTTRERGGVRLERRSGDGWQFVSGRHDEVGLEVGRLLGMTHEQFCQVVLLPQGDFAAFLTANAETRKHLLERLFGTERFTAVEQWLLARSQQAAADLAQAREDVAGLIAALRGLDRSDDPVVPDVRMPADVINSWAGEMVDRLEARLTIAERAATDASAEVRERRAALAEVAAVAQRQAERARLLADDRELTEQRATIEAAEAEVADARRAHSVEPLLAVLDDAADEAAAADDERGAALAALSGFPSVGETIGDTAIEHALQVVRDEIARLADLRNDDERLAELRREIAEHDAALQRLADDEHRAAAALEELPAERTRLDVALIEQRTLAALVGQRREAVSGLTAKVAAAERRDALTAEVASAAAEHRAAVDAAHATRERWLTLYEARLDGIAAELASGLEPGTGCPVCGSTTHPSPAPPTEQRTSEAAERAAREAAEAAERHRAEAQTRWAELIEARAMAAAEAGGEQPAEELRQAVEEAVAACREAESAASSLPRLSAAKDEVEAGLVRLAGLVDAARSEAAELSGRRNALARQADQLDGRLRVALQGAGSVAERHEVLIASASALENARTAIARADAARRALDEAERRAEREARRAGFPDARAAALAARPSARIDEAVAAIEAHRMARAVVDAGLARPEISSAPAEPVDLAAAEAAAHAADAAERAAQLELGWLRPAATRAGELCRDLRAAVDRMSPLQREWETVDGLAKLANGGSDNRLRMRLSYYVLSARLEQVAAAASDRLLRMSDGRFSLTHTDERSPGNQRSGLGLRVHDSWYATDRDPATLSGGESFLASLALALGLADVVTAEAGGTTMRTLFVDEGFGGLDNETLDAVLDVLDGLRAGGRAIGLVSHVTELRSRIPVQLGVRRAREGSTLSLIA